MSIPDFGSNIALASFIVGFFLPLAIAAINRAVIASEIKAIVAFVASLVAAALLIYVSGLVDLRDWLRSSLVIMFMAIVTYETYWKPSGIAPRIEGKVVEAQSVVRQ